MKSNKYVEKKPKLLIIVLFQNLRENNPYYAKTPSPPIPGLLLAGMTPPIVEVEVLHEMVRPIDYSTDAEFIAISFMDYLSPHAYEVADRFKAMGKIVVGGGSLLQLFLMKCKSILIQFWLVKLKMFGLKWFLIWLKEN